ncbi:nitroreductase/quinone reductase family protein [Streptomyces sp. NPDC001250]|uniref:nitroreductase/quinone reductase family protein n=1 Tax=Streptomyces sp. NPDC001250 TaxID=3154382 RepID=UPI003322ECA8
MSPGPRFAAAHRRSRLGRRPSPQRPAATATQTRYYNLLAYPEVRIEVGDDVVAVRAVELSGAERDAAFTEQARRHPGFAGYQRKTHRVISAVTLIPTGGEGGPAPADHTERTSS